MERLKFTNRDLILCLDEEFRLQKIKWRDLKSRYNELRG